jgi:hypothetical protein
MTAAVELPPNHRRVLSTTAARVERELEEMERLLRSENPSRVTTTIHVAYSREQRQKILETIHEMRRVNEQMFGELHLEASQFNEERIIRARAAHLWTVLVDSLSTRTRGYGELTADAASDVDRHVEKLLALVGSLLESCTP